MAIIDLTHQIVEGMPVFPETEPPEICCANTIEEHGFREKRISMFSHTGTHMDAPAHMKADGRTLDQFPVETFFGDACIYVHPEADGNLITIEQLEPLAKQLRGVDFLLIATGWDKYWGMAEYFGDFPTLAESAAKWLTQFNLKGLGLDVISADPMASRDFPVHLTLFSRHMVIIENLKDLIRIGQTVCQFSCLPLNLTEADGAPVRALAITV